MSQNTLLFSSNDMAKALTTLADAIVSEHKEGSSLALIGIQRRGVDIAKRLQQMLEEKFSNEIPLGSLDITLYRDDWTTATAKPSVRETAIPFSIEQKTLILVDDVLYTGRTIRSALEALSDFGRPACVKLLVLVDRGHRELPIQADYVGKTVTTKQQDHVNVHLVERDGEDSVYLIAK